MTKVERSNKARQSRLVVGVGVGGGSFLLLLKGIFRSVRGVLRLDESKEGASNPALFSHNGHPDAPRKLPLQSCPLLFPACLPLGDILVLQHGDNSMPNCNLGLSKCQLRPAGPDVELAHLGGPLASGTNAPLGGVCEDGTAHTSF